MSVSPARSERSREKSPENTPEAAVAVVEPVKKSSKYVMTCGTPSPPPPKSPAEISTKNAQNYTSFSISSILSKQDATKSANADKGHQESKSTNMVEATNLSTSNQLQSTAGFMSHISGATAALHPCSTDSLMLSR